MFDAPPPIPFEAFMARALHHPDHGYYARRIPSIGSRGDFTTAPHLSSLPARAVASWAARALREHRTRHLIEIGPGNALLAAGVLRRLPWWLRRRVRLHLVETSPPLAALQRERLGARPLWHRHPSEALRAAGGEAVIYSNELVDAFPVRRFRHTPGGWREIGLLFDPIRETLLPASPLPPSSSFLQNHPPGQEIEVHDAYRRWLGEWLPLWKSGSMLTIDYGATADRLYHRKPRGTLRAYLLQQRLEGPEVYRNIGRQDLTADVNFTDLADWSSSWCETRSLSAFGDFLRPHRRASASANDRALLDPEGPGGAFLVLDQIRRP